MSSYVVGIWKCRHFWWSLAQNDLRTRYRRSFLGIAWSLLQPISMTAVLCVVFQSLFNQNIKEFAPSIMIGMCFWNFITACTLQGGQCLFQGEAYIRQYPAPLAIYPLRTALGASFHFGMSLLVVLALRWGFLGFDNLKTLIAVVPALLLMFVLGWSLAALSGFLTAYFPDMQHLSEVALQILFYATPIIYPASMLRSKGLGLLVDINPIACILQLFRDPILAATFPSMRTLGIACLTVSVLAGSAMLTLSRLQKTIIFQL